MNFFTQRCRWPSPLAYSLPPLEQSPLGCRSPCLPRLDPTSRSTATGILKKLPSTPLHAMPGVVLLLLFTIKITVDLEDVPLLLLQPWHVHVSLWRLFPVDTNCDISVEKLSDKSQNGSQGSRENGSELPQLKKVRISDIVPDDLKLGSPNNKRLSWKIESRDDGPGIDTSIPKLDVGQSMRSYFDITNIL